MSLTRSLEKWKPGRARAAHIASGREAGMFARCAMFVAGSAPRRTVNVASGREEGRKIGPSAGISDAGEQRPWRGAESSSNGDVVRVFWSVAMFRTQESLGEESFIRQGETHPRGIVRKDHSAISEPCPGNPRARETDRHTHRVGPSTSLYPPPNKNALPHLAPLSLPSPPAPTHPASCPPIRMSFSRHFPSSPHSYSRLSPQKTPQ